MEMLGNRGQEGVFDLHELIDVLRAENVQDILTVKVPHDFNYAGEEDGFAIVSSPFPTSRMQLTLGWMIDRREYGACTSSGKSGTPFPFFLLIKIISSSEPGFPFGISNPSWNT